MRSGDRRKGVRVRISPALQRHIELKNIFCVFILKSVFFVELKLKSVDRQEIEVATKIQKAKMNFNSDNTQLISICVLSMFNAHNFTLLTLHVAMLL